MRRVCVARGLKIIRSTNEQVVAVMSAWDSNRSPDRLLACWAASEQPIGTPISDVQKPVPRVLLVGPVPPPLGGGG
jgi:hypothetical protein